ncbi:hypothetical protein HD806DRAFT_493876 [Xylariaceae sp. AK1471]|nr:hypothetical protein HD806DRAFT_493876 [Xylariaceae sp. AK1471]
MAPTIVFPAVGGAVRRLLQANPSEAIKPTRTLPQAITKVLAGRQATTTVVTDSGNKGTTALSGGAIAGIVIGSIAGVLLVLWIIRSCSNLGRPGIWGSTFEPEREREKPARSSAYYADPHRHRSRSRHSHHSHRHSRSPRHVEVIQPVVHERRDRSPRAPPATYYGGRSSYDGREVRRSSDARRYNGY